MHYISSRFRIGWYLYSPSTPYGLFQFEEGFPAEPAEYLGWDEDKDADNFGIDYCNIDYWTALPFAAYRPSL
jgi:hypothetical protein